MPLVLIGPTKYVDSINSPAAELLGIGISGRHYATVLRQPALLGAIESTLKTGKQGTVAYHSAVGDQETLFSVKCVQIDESDEREHERLQAEGFELVAKSVHYEMTGEEHTRTEAERPV